MEVKLPIRKWNYYKGYSSDNYSGHTQAIELGNIVYYFSYDTVVAFKYKGQQYTSENCWNRTTGKHLNSLEPDNQKRIKREIFEKLLNKAIKGENYE